MRNFKLQKILFIFTLINISYNLSTKIVTLPFNELSTDSPTEFNSSTISKLFENQYKNQIYTILKIGKPEQSMMCIFNSENSIFLVGSYDDCYLKKEYNYSMSESSSSKIVEKYEGDEYDPGYSIINETIQLYTDISLKRLEEVQDFQLRYEEPKKSWGGDDPIDKIFCGEIGFQINNAKNPLVKFIKQLKDANFINLYVLTMKYDSENSGYFYIGEYPHIYDNKNFKEKQLMTTYAIPKSSFAQFRILMDEIYVIDSNKTKYNLRDNEVYFHTELGLIEGPLEYYNYVNNHFFNKYLQKNICSSYKASINLNYYNITICEDDKNFNMSEFPILYFYHRELNLTFSLDYKDLFKKINNNKYLFLVSYSSFSSSYWNLGKPFLKKYQITLNLDAKTISFYNFDIKDDKDENSEINNSNNIILIIIGFVLTVALIGITIYFTIQLKDKRRRRANELNDDNFDYPIEKYEDKNENESNPYKIINKDEKLNSGSPIN